MKLGIDAGHGGINFGTRFGPGHEKDETFELAQALADSLFGAGIETNLIRLCDEDMGFGDRGFKSGRAKCDVVFCIHINANKNSSFRGFETYYYVGNDRGKAIALHMNSQAEEWYPKTRIYEAIDRPGDPSDDWLERPETVVSAHAATAVLIEVGYATNSEDLKFMRSMYGRQALVSVMRSGAIYAATLFG